MTLKGDIFSRSGQNGGYLVDSGFFAQYYKKSTTPVIKIRSFNCTHSFLQEWIQENTVLWHCPPWLPPSASVCKKTGENHMIQDQGKRFDSARSRSDLEHTSWWTRGYSEERARLTSQVSMGLHTRTARSSVWMLPGGYGVLCWTPRGVKGRIQYEVIVKHVYRCHSYVIYTVAVIICLKLPLV